MASETLFPGVAVVTGAAGTGIGAATARAFAEAGCKRIAITDLNNGLLQSTKESIEQSHPSVNVFADAGDVTDDAFSPKFHAAVAREFGRIDYAVNCAGVLGDNQTSTDTTIKTFDHINNVNYRGCWMCSREQLKIMVAQEPLPNPTPSRRAGRGSIVNIASQLGIVGRPKCAAYSGSKAAVIAMTRADAIDYSEHGIRVNCICPGIIDTPMTNDTPDKVEMLKPSIPIAPMNRVGRPEEIADCALFLCSTKASFVQGSAMVVDGGYIIN